MSAPLHLLRRALQAFTAQWQSQIGDVTPPQYAVLLTLDARPGIDQSRLGAASGIDLATLASLLYRLEERGLITRRVDPDNRRRKLLALTEAGHQTLADVAPLADAVDKKVMSRIAPHERSILLDMLSRISHADHDE